MHIATPWPNFFTISAGEPVFCCACIKNRHHAAKAGRQALVLVLVGAACCKACAECSFLSCRAWCRSATQRFVYATTHHVLALSAQLAGGVQAIPQIIVGKVCLGFTGLVPWHWICPCTALRLCAELWCCGAFCAHTSHVAGGLWSRSWIQEHTSST